MKAGSGYEKLVKGMIALAALGAALIVWALLQHGEDAFNLSRPEPFTAVRLAFGVSLLIVGVICAWYFRRCAREAEKLASGEKALARWTLTSSEHQAFATEVYEREQGANAGALMAVGILIGLALLMQLIIQLDWGTFLLVVLGILAIWGITGFVMPKWTLWRMLRQEVASTAVGLRMGYVLGAHALWPDVEWVKLERGETVHMMTIRHRQRMWSHRTGILPIYRQTHHYTAYVPVPRDRYAEGAEVARQIAEAHGAALTVDRGAEEE